MSAATTPVMYRPICCCDLCRRRDQYKRRTHKRRYYPCETRIIIAEMSAAGSAPHEIADVLGTTVNAVRYMRLVIAAEGTEVRTPHRRRTKVTASADEIIRRLRAGEPRSVISEQTGVNVNQLLTRIRQGRSKRPVDAMIVAAAGPPIPRGQRNREWVERRRSEAALRQQQAQARQPSAC